VKREFVNRIDPEYHAKLQLARNGVLTSKEFVSPTFKEHGSPCWRRGRVGATPRKTVMSVRELVKGSEDLFHQRNYVASLALALVALEAVARRRYPSKKSGQRFKQFINDEARKHFFMCKYAVDAPALPDPPAEPARPAPTASLDEFVQHAKLLSAWHDKVREASHKWIAQFDDAGDDFFGVGSSLRGKPRFVTTTGMLYQARCELVHEGGFSEIHFDPVGHDLALIRGEPPTLSPHWIAMIIEMVKQTREYGLHSG